MNFLVESDVVWGMCIRLESVAPEASRNAQQPNGFSGCCE